MDLGCTAVLQMNFKWVLKCYDIGLIMGGMLYEPEGRIEHASHDQTYLVHGWGRGRGLNIMACVSMFSEI